MFTSMHIAKKVNPSANFFPFDISLDQIDSIYLTAQLYHKLEPIFEYYKINVTEKDLQNAIKSAIDENQKLKDKLEDLVISSIEDAIEKKVDIMIVCGREYVLNP
jgi:hypothetical protein